MTKQEEAALAIVEKTVCLFEEIANLLSDDKALQTYAERGVRSVSSDMPPLEILKSTWTTAHIVNVRLGKLQSDGQLEHSQAARVQGFRARLEAAIRDSLRLAKPDDYAFLGGNHE